MLKSTFKVNYNFFNVTQFMYFKIDNIPNLIKKSLHMIHFTSKSRLFDLQSVWTNIFAKNPEKSTFFQIPSP